MVINRGADAGMVKQVPGYGFDNDAGRGEQPYAS